jgi:quercetin dioxygenase-like cupin family protein
MKSGLAIVLFGAIVAATAIAAETEHDKHVFVNNAQVVFNPGPSSLPMGGQAAVLYGDPSKAGPFVMRLKMPKGYRIPPHTHPKAEIVTVLSGTLNLGIGAGGDEKAARSLPAGSFAALETGTVHYAFANEETVVQINGEGPWGITYVNPKDDPRQQARTQ